MERQALRLTPSGPFTHINELSTDISCCDFGWGKCLLEVFIGGKGKIKVCWKEVWEREKQVFCSMGLNLPYFHFFSIFLDTSRKCCCGLLNYAEPTAFFEKERTSMNVQLSLRAPSPEHFLKECLVVGDLAAGRRKQSWFRNGLPSLCLAPAEAQPCSNVLFPLSSRTFLSFTHFIAQSTQSQFLPGWSIVVSQ